MSFIFFLNILVSFLLTGIIWTIQLVHYPSFNFVNKLNFLDFHKFHSTKISFIVIPLMLIEFFSALALLIRDSSSSFLWINFGLIVLIWLSTFFIQVPLHNILSQRKDKVAISRLVSTNWIRTTLWSIKTLFLIDQIIL